MGKLRITEGRSDIKAGLWLAYAALSLGALGAVLYMYRRREPAGRGRTLLALLRWAAIALLLLLLFNPRLAQPLDPADGNVPVLLDNSVSMLLPAADGGTQWTRGIAEARKRAGGAPVTLFGTATRKLTTDSLAAAQPAAVHSRLLPALQTVAEAGARRVVIVSDGAIEDGDAIARWLPRLGVQIEWVGLGDAAANTQLTDIRAPAWAEANKPFGVQLAVQTTGRANGDSIRIALRQDGRALQTLTVASPALGRTTEVTAMVLPAAPPGGGYVRIEAAVGDDAFADDNVRNAYVYVSDEPGGIVLVSYAPDWEPRFLLPVLERATGLPARGFLKTADGSWLRLGAGLEAGNRATDVAVQRAVARADLLVLHAVPSSAPAWLATAAADARRLLAFPNTGGNGIALPVQVATAANDDWFAGAEVPASPVSSLLAGMKIDDAPPLDALMSAAAPAGAWTPMVATRGRGGRPSPLALAGEDAGKRWAVALGSGYWRWAFRGGDAGDIYTRLWSALGGWLTREARGADIAAVRPVSRTVFRGEPVQWVTRAGALDSVRVRLQSAAGDTTVTIAAQNDTASQTAIPSGTYRYETAAYAGATTVTASGELTVERYTPEFSRMSAPLASGETAPDALNATSAGATRPLHASFIPYVLLVLMLATEWILRRRWGLR